MPCFVCNGDAKNQTTTTTISMACSKCNALHVVYFIPVNKVRAREEKRWAGRECYRSNFSAPPAPTAGVLITTHGAVTAKVFRRRCEMRTFGGACTLPPRNTRRNWRIFQSESATNCKHRAELYEFKVFRTAAFCFSLCTHTGKQGVCVCVCVRTYLYKPMRNNRRRRDLEGRVVIFFRVGDLQWVTCW
jgi:hypothetical protein